MYPWGIVKRGVIFVYYAYCATYAEHATSMLMF